jgi:hypothetical protein
LNPLLHLRGSITTLDGALIPEARDGFLVVKRWAREALSKYHGTARQASSQRVLLAGSRLTMYSEDKWEGTLHLERLRSAIMKVTELFGLLLDPRAGPGLAWDGITLYRLQQGTLRPYLYY